MSAVFPFTLCQNSYWIRFSACEVRKDKRCYLVEREDNNRWMTSEQIDSMLRVRFDLDEEIEIDTAKSLTLQPTFTFEDVCTHVMSRPNVLNKKQI